MVKTADSAAISEYMPTFPREGSRQSIAACSLVAFMRLSGSFVEPVGIFRMLEVPQRPAALHDRNGGEVVLGGRRGHGPLERPRVPGVTARARPPEIRPREVDEEHEDARGLEGDADGDDQVPDVPAASWLVGVDPARHPEQPWDVHEIEGEMEADDEEPEMHLRQRLVVHLSRDFREPVIEAAEERKDDGADDDVVEMGDDEIRTAQLPIERRTPEHDSRQPRDEELEQERGAEEHRGLELDLSAPHRREPVEDLDPGRYGNGHRRQD